MAANRTTKHAPQFLTRVSKTTLAELVWDLASVASPSCDDAEAVAGILLAGAKVIGAPRYDLRTLETLQAIARRAKGGV